MLVTRRSGDHNAPRADGVPALAPSCSSDAFRANTFPCPLSSSCRPSKIHHCQSLEHRRLLEYSALAQARPQTWPPSVARRAANVVEPRRPARRPSQTTIYVGAGGSDRYACRSEGPVDRGHFPVPLGDITPTAITFMTDYGMASYDAAHAATAISTGAETIVTLDTWLAQPSVQSSVQSSVQARGYRNTANGPRSFCVRSVCDPFAPLCDRFAILPPPIVPERARNRPRRSSVATSVFAHLRGPSQILVISGRPDLNRRPFAPKANALPGCATPRDDHQVYCRSERAPNASHPGQRC